jgi:hypothetical protein
MIKPAIIATILSIPDQGMKNATAIMIIKPIIVSKPPNHFANFCRVGTASKNHTQSINPAIMFIHSIIFSLLHLYYFIKFII